MKYKEELLNNLSEIENLISNKDIPNKLQNQLTKVENDLKNFKIYIPLVGAFNSGKSSLINKYLGEDLLPTNIKPETAIAAEIKYGDNDKVFAHDSDGKKDKFEIEDINEISSSQYKYIEVVKNNYKLKKLTEKNNKLTKKKLKKIKKGKNYKKNKN